MLVFPHQYSCYNGICSSSVSILFSDECLGFSDECLGVKRECYLNNGICSSAVSILFSDECLGVKRECYLNCSVLHCGTVINSSLSLADIQHQLTLPDHVSW